MSNFARIPALLCSLIAAVAFAQVRADAAAGGSVDQLAWLAGCWHATSEKNDTQSREVWLRPAGGNMLGMGQTVGGGKTLGWEAMRLYNDGPSVKAWLRPGGRAELTLPLEKIEDGLVSFALTEGDTTTRLTYQRRGADDLSASFRRIKGGEQRGPDYAFRRQVCDDGLSATK